MAAIWAAGWRDGPLGNVPDELTRGWADQGLFDYVTPVTGGTGTVPCHRHAKDLRAEA